jgi:class 3 adenylate cyclase
MAAIAELKDTPELGTAAAAPVAPHDTAERRQVTVMFSDLVGSTALSARIDPEDLREVISAYQKCVAETVQRFGGFVAKYMGDGVLVYFGYPQAHEDDAERAVRAGLELVSAVGALKSHAPLQSRIGIATGLVVVGDLIGSGASQEQAIVGETPNLAARLQGIAEPNNVVIAESTRKLVGNLFELEDLGGHGPQGYLGAGANLGGAAALFSREPLRRSPRKRPHRACRTRGRTRTAAAAMVESEDRRRSGGAAIWRTGHWQISINRCTARTDRV